MKYELSENGDFVCDCPDETPLENWTVAPLPQPINTPKFIGERLETGEWVGEWVDAGPQELSTELKVFNEKLWRNIELDRADIKLNKVQDGMGTGTVSAWREYRCSLRDWPESPNFPDSTKRPVAPDA